MTYHCHLHSSLYECLCCRLRDITRDATDLEFLGQRGVGEDGLDDGAALIAGSAENSNELGHFVCSSDFLDVRTRLYVLI